MSVELANSSKIGDLNLVFTMQLLVKSPTEFLAAGVRRGWSSQRRVVRIYAGDNKRQPNFIDIGAATRGGWDQVRVLRTSTPAEPKKAKHRESAPPSPAPPAYAVDVKPEQQNLIVEATKRGRGGKTVTVIKGLQLRTESLESLCKSLKVKMGSGGAAKDGEIVIQGDHSVKLLEELLKLGFQAKKSGR